MDLGLKGKVYLVVGASDGMGLATADAIAAEGGELALVARGKERLQGVAADLSTKHGVPVSAHPADPSTPEGIDSVVEQVLAEQGRLDGLAVLAGPAEPYGDVLALKDADWDYYIQKHLMLTVRCCRAALPHMIEAGRGSIVTCGAYSVRQQKPAVVALTAAKSAIVSVTKNISKTYGPSGIRANCICPGMIDTASVPADREALKAEYGLPPSEALYRYAEEKWGMTLALRRVGQPAEVGALAAMLMSDRIGYVTGATINIDGGTDF
ncbi:MAG TPA: SDR family oxidoreductase [Pseudonocardia sp.]|jgi:NAD(P)-dependent dehydrogenase (short-subunit alcohol dehydrogenase family)